MIIARRSRPDILQRGQLRLGDGVVFEAGPIRTHVMVERGATLDIGDRVAIGFGVGIACQSSIHIGDDAVLGPYVQLLDSAFHVTDAHRDRPEPQPIVIGEGAVLGAWAMVLPGGRVAAGARVPPGTVVTSSRP